MLSPAQRKLRARAAAHALHAQGGTNTKAGTAAFLERFERQVDPDGRLTPEERTRRAAHARRSYMTSLALKASRTRTKMAATSLEVVTADVEGTRDADHAA
ncbi:MAG: hypothetical protein H0U37_02765 [Chloroflexi bacterium]|nr:hypothetical protein [Chloroflexota bacterium]